MATAPEFEGTQEEWDEGMKRQTKILSDKADLHNAYRNRKFLNENDTSSFLHGGRKSRRHGKKSRRHGKKSRKSRRHSKKSRKCRR